MSTANVQVAMAPGITLKYDLGAPYWSPGDTLTSNANDQGAPGGAVAAVVIVSVVIIMVKIAILFSVWDKITRIFGGSPIAPDSRFQTLTMDKFLNDMEREKPIRFTSRLYGFCFDEHLRALVYEYMGNGSLDKYLFLENNILGFEKLHEIAVGTAKGIAYLHEECQQRIIHYDIKPGNILLDPNFFPKVADFGLAKLCNRENTHISMTGGRGTPGYAAPEMWMPFPITHKCDVYSFGMLLFEILGRRRNLNIQLPESQQWFPRWVWKKFEDGELGELTIVCGVEENRREILERMVKIALWCVQYRPESRPVMSVVVKMLEGAVEIPTPLCPFQHMLDVTPDPNSSFNPLQSGSTFDSNYSSQMVTGSGGFVCDTPVMRKYEIQIAST